MSSLIQLKAARVNFGAVQALVDVDLGVTIGERVALIGSNGCGKSTLLKVLHGLITPTRGSVLRDSAKRQAMVFQRPYMLRTSVLNNVALGLWMRGARWGQSKERALAALARVGLAEVALRSARALSGGQQQRLALARAWSLRPDVLFLDEPTSSLDPQAHRDVEALMTEFSHAGMTLVFASHNLGQVKRLATRVVYLEQGRVLADLPVNEFFNASRLGETSREADLFVKGELI